MGRQGTSSVIGVVLLIGVVVVIGGVVATFGFGVADELADPAPTTAETTGSFNYSGGYGALSCGTNRIEFVHEGGERIDVSEIEIVVRTVDTPSAADARAFDLPVSGTSFDEDDNLSDPDNVIRDGCVRGAIANDDGQWSAGGHIAFEVNIGDDTGDIDPGDRVEVLVVHEPSGAIIIEETFVAE